MKDVLTRVPLFARLPNGGGSGAVATSPVQTVRDAFPACCAMPVPAVLL